MSYFRGLIDKDCDVTVELKNDIEITGKIKYIDNNMCLYLEDISVKDPEKYPQFVSSVNLQV
jgi:U6 snRNA-associated Sm-like protein LSm2